MSAPLEHITEAKVVRVQPGDVVWITTDARLRAEDIKRIHDHVKKLWPENTVVVGADVDVELIRSTEDAA